MEFQGLQKDNSTSQGNSNFTNLSNNGETEKETEINRQTTTE